MLMPRNGFSHQTSEKEMSHQLKKQYSIKYLDIRYIESNETPTTSAAKVTLLVADRKSSLAIELKDDLKDIFTEVVGRSNYSNNKIVVLSYIAIFENLWNQSELNQQIRQAYEQLKIHDTIHEEFINIQDIFMIQMGMKPSAKYDEIYERPFEYQAMM